MPVSHRKLELHVRVTTLSLHLQFCQSIHTQEAFVQRHSSGSKATYYGDQEETWSVDLVLSWPQHVNSWERDMSWP